MHQDDASNAKQAMDDNNDHAPGNDDQDDGNDDEDDVSAARPIKRRKKTRRVP